MTTVGVLSYPGNKGGVVVGLHDFTSCQNAAHSNKCFFSTG